MTKCHVIEKLNNDFKRNMEMIANNEFMLMKALNFKYIGTNDTGKLLEYAIENGDLDNSETAPIKNVCAKLAVPLVDKLEDVCETLGMSKRAFIEIALTNLIAEFEAIADEYDIYSTHIPSTDSDKVNKS